MDTCLASVRRPGHDWLAQKYEITYFLWKYLSKVFYSGLMRTTIHNAVDLGHAFRAERKALGKTQRQVAEATRFRRQTILDLEAGRNVSLHVLMAALAALGKGLAIVDARLEADQLQQLLDPVDED